MSSMAAGTLSPTGHRTFASDQPVLTSSSSGNLGMQIGFRRYVGSRSRDSESTIARNGNLYSVILKGVSRLILRCILVYEG